MSKIYKTQAVVYAAKQMYDLVNDVSRYSEFLPACARSEILQQDGAVMEASLTFAKAGMQQSFSTRNQLQPHSRIEMSLLDGPFKQLIGCWQFEDQGEGGSQVSLDIQFEFSNSLLAMAFGSTFRQVADRMVEVFCRELRQ